MKKRRIFAMAMAAFLLPFGLMIARCDNGTTDDDDGNGDTGTLTINDYVDNNQVLRAGISSTTITNQNYLSVLQSNLAAGSVYHSGVIELSWWGTDQTTGSYNILIESMVNSEPSYFFKNGVQFTNGPTTINLSEMTLVTGDGGGGDGGQSVAGTLTIQGYSGGGTYVYIYPYTGTAPTTQLAYGQIISRNQAQMAAYGDAENGPNIIL
jgi:hypothetical protein